MNKLRTLATRAATLARKALTALTWARAHKATVLLAAVAVLHLASQYLTSVPSDGILDALRALLGA